MKSLQSVDNTEDFAAAYTVLDSVCVIIPALNEERSLPLMLGDLPKVGRVIVVDNGSVDATAEVAQRCGATVVSEPQRGYGAACLRGLKAIRASIQVGGPAPDIVVFLDADYSDHPDLLPRLVEPIVSGEAEFVLGSKLRGDREPGAMPPQSVYGNKLACFLVRLLFRMRYSDLGPFRAIDYAKLCELEMADENFGWTIEMQIKAARGPFETPNKGGTWSSASKDSSASAKAIGDRMIQRRVSRSLCN